MPQGVDGHGILPEHRQVKEECWQMKDGWKFSVIFQWVKNKADTTEGIL